MNQIDDRRQQSVSKSGRKLRPGKTLDCSFVQEKEDEGTGDFVSLREKVDNFFQEDTYSCQRSSTKKNRKFEQEERRAQDHQYDSHKLTRP